jgi:DNA-binding MarR family transcriptional regulator
MQQAATINPAREDDALREPGFGVFQLEKFLPFRLSVLANRLARRVARAAAGQFQLSAPEWRVIAVLGRFGALPNHQVIELTCLDPVRTSRAVSSLMRKAYINRVETPSDRRRATLELTASGTEVFEAMIPLAVEAEEGVLGAASEADRAQLEAILTKLENAAEGEDGASEDDSPV